MEIFPFSARFTVGVDAEPLPQELVRDLPSARNLCVSLDGKRSSDGRIGIRVTGIAIFRLGLTDFRQAIRDYATEQGWQNFDGLVGDERFYVN